MRNKFLAFFQRTGIYDRFDPGTEQAYLDFKFKDTKSIALGIGIAAPLLATGLWVWDWAQDPDHIMQALPSRILMGALALPYPIGLVAGIRRSLFPWLLFVVALAVEAAYLYHLTFVDRGMIYGIAGFMYWFIFPIFMGLPCSFAASLVLYPAIAILPNLLVPLGIAPQFELLKYNALIWPTSFLALYGSHLFDRLYRRLFLYRQRIEALAHNDPLTGVANRRHFMDITLGFIELCRRRNHPISIIMIDVDHFKRINDEYGHPEGDKIIRAVAEVIGSNLRTMDLLGRYGGEEFAVVLPETGPEEALAAAERIRKAMEEHRVVVRDENLPLQVTISAGVAGYRDLPDGIGIEELIKQADAQLYEAKHRGRNCVVLANVEMQRELF